jgi:hypothetical protein
MAASSLQHPESEMERYAAEQAERAREEWRREVMRDACPECDVVADPSSWAMDDGGRYAAIYRCEACGNRWRCGFARSYVEQQF